MSSRHHAPLRSALFILACVLGTTRPAEAYKNGIQTLTCGACHRNNGMTAAMVTLTPDHTPVLPGDTVSFEATITAPNIQDGGIFVVAPEVGLLATSAGQGLTLSDGSLTHSAPKAAENGNVTFDFTWQAPAEPGAVNIQIYALAGNGNVQNSGDLPGATSLAFTFGCEPATYYFDADGDGYGGMTTLTALGCAGGPSPRAYAPTADDCDEAYATVHPGAPERCNGKDDNCDGNIDENTVPEPLYPDLDGDGFYGLDPGESIVGCLPLEGYADEMGDCAPSEPGRHPGAEEVCNLKDDDCDGRVDESVRPRCGVGRCEVESSTCDPADCHAGAPMSETCNGLDDDCNGVVDDSGDLCPDGQQCLGLRCVVVDEGADTGSGGTAGMPAGPSGGLGTGGATGGTAGATASGTTGGTGAAPDPDTTTSTGATPSGVTSGAERPASCGVALPRRASVGGLVLSLVALVSVRRRQRPLRR